MRFEIAQSLNGNKVMYIARDTGGVVRLREETLDEIHEAVKKYNEDLAAEAESRIKAKAKNKGKEKNKEEGESVKGKEEAQEEALEEATDEAVAETEAQVAEPITQAQNEQPQENQSKAIFTSPDEPKKEFLHSDLKDQIEEKKRKSGKKTFWDKLK